MPAKYDFPEIIKGDTFRARTVTIVADSFPLDLTGALVTMKLKGSINSKAVHTFDITLTDPTIGIITIGNWDVDVEPFNYLYDLKITLNNGQSLTYLNGKFPVKTSISND